MKSNTYYDVESGAIIENNNADKNRKIKDKKNKSYIKRIWRKRKNRSLGFFLAAMSVAILLDIIRVIKNTIIALLILGFICSIILAIVAWNKIEPYYTEYHNFAVEAVSNSDYNTFRPQETTFIYDANGNILTKLKGNQDAAYLSFEEIPNAVIDAFVAVEDRSFWSNPGIDIKGLVRVGVDAVRTRGAEIHGASTITQQLARNIFLTHEVSLERKGKEMLIALELTETYSKREIMEFYVNNICYANAFYGLEAASKGYFNKSSSELTLSQLCYICAIPNSPEYYNPYKHPERAVIRRDKILGDMLELDFITKEQYDEAIAEEIVIEKPEYQFNDYLSTYAIDCSTRYIMGKDGFEFRYSFDNMTDYNEYKALYEEAYTSANYKLVTSGYRIYTTLDPNIQGQMQLVIDEQLAFDSEIDEETQMYSLQGALTVIDNSNNKVVALIGGRSQEDKPEIYGLNRAYQSYRQPGSTIKPLVVYTPALMTGYTPDSLVMNISISAAKVKGTNVQELTGDVMTLRSALEHSKNGVAWQIFDKFGANYCMEFAEGLRFSSLCPNDYFNSSSLGGLTYGTTTVEMAGAYNSLYNHGKFTEPTCIDKFIDKEGNNIYEEESPTTVYSEKAADTMVDMMTGVLTRGTAAKLGWYRNTDMIAACKTGTTNQSKDGWLCGFTPYYTVSVWVGYDTPRELSGLYGATYPGQIWKEAMLLLNTDKEIITEFEKTQAYYEPIAAYGDLPEYVYEVYMPGRDDSEILSGTYTVHDYRLDRWIGESVSDATLAMTYVDMNDERWAYEVTDYYYKGVALINTIRSASYKEELQIELDRVHNEVIALYNQVHPGVLQ